MKLPIAVGLFGLALGWILCKQWPSPPIGPSRDSTTVVAIDTILGRGKARADSSVAASKPVVTRLKVRSDSVNETAKAKLDSTRKTTPPADQVAELDYWKARALSAEILLDLNIAANKVIDDSLSAGWYRQLDETARLSALVGQVQDSLSLLSIAIGAKDRALARSDRACEIGTVNFGVTTVGKPALTFGVSCRPLKLVKKIL